MNENLAKRLSDANKERYSSLKATAPDLFRHCVESASAIAFNNGLNTKVAAAIESALVAMALEGMAVV